MSGMSPRPGSYAHLIVPDGGKNAEALDVIVGKLLHLLSVP